MKHTKLSPVFFVNASTPNSNIKNIIPSRTLNFSWSGQVWLRTKPLTSSNIHTLPNGLVIVNTQTPTLIYSKTLFSHHVRFNKNHSLHFALALTFSQPTALVQTTSLRWWLAHISNFTSHSNITFELLKISLFPFFQTLSNLTTRYRRPAHTTPALLTNLTINL